MAAPYPGPLVSIFAWVSLDGSKSGATYSADATNEPYWQGFTYFLTDGVPNEIRAYLLFIPSGAGGGPDVTGPELPGMIITRADLHLNHVYLYPGPYYVEYSFDATLSFYGTGPTAAGELSWGRLKRLYR